MPVVGYRSPPSAGVEKTSAARDFFFERPREIVSRGVAMHTGRLRETP